MTYVARRPRDVTRPPAPSARCDGSGFARRRGTTAPRARRARCRPQRIAAQARARARRRGMPKRFRGVVVRPRAGDATSRADPTRCARCARYVRDHRRATSTQGRGLWFTGDVGTGKTTLAMLVSKAALEAGRTVAIYSLPRLLGLLRETYDDDAERSLSELLDRLAAVDLLHIDDVGAEQTTDWVLEQLYSIVNARYEDERAM